MTTSGALLSLLASSVIPLACRNAGNQTKESGGRAPMPEPALDPAKLGASRLRTNIDATRGTTLEERVPLLEPGPAPEAIPPGGDVEWKASAKPLVVASGERRAFAPTLEAQDACVSRAKNYGTPLVHGVDGRASLSVCLGRAPWFDGNDARTFGSALTREAGSDGRVHYRLEKHGKFHLATVTLVRPANAGQPATAVAAVVELFPSARDRSPIGRCLVGRFEPIPVADRYVRCKVHGFELHVRRSGTEPVLRIVSEGAVLAVVPFAEVTLP